MSEPKLIPRGTPFGHRITVSPVFARMFGGISRVCVRVRCKCGRESDAIVSALQRGCQRECLVCSSAHRGLARRKYAGTTKFERRREARLLRQYGLTSENFEIWLAAQGSRCRICKTDKPGGQNWHLDHCHRPKRLRGILCHRCNRVIGIMRENPETLRAAADYLERTNGRAKTIEIRAA